MALVVSTLTVPGTLMVSRLMVVAVAREWLRVELLVTKRFGALRVPLTSTVAFCSVTAWVEGALLMRRRPDVPVVTDEGEVRFPAHSGLAGPGTCWTAVMRRCAVRGA